MTVHSAFCPQVSGQGSIHLFRKHALSLEQSVFSTHSGLQAMYGFPWYSERQVQIPLLHSAFDPHGEGLHKSGGGSGATIIVDIKTFGIN